MSKSSNNIETVAAHIAEKLRKCANSDAEVFKNRDWEDTQTIWAEYLRDELYNWVEVKQEMPDKSFLDKRTEFLVRGYFEIEGKRGSIIHKVLKLDDLNKDSDNTYFNGPADFVPTHWMFLPV